MSEHAPQLSALVPVSVVHRSRRVDMAVPPTVALVEMLPGMLSSLDLLTTASATRGFAVHTADGRLLDPARTLTDQRVGAGAVLTLSPLDNAVGAQRYDDLVEAIGTSVEQSRSPWRRSDAVTLSTFSAVGLFVVAAALMTLRGNGSVLSGVVMLIGAALVAATAAVVARVPALDAAAALALSVPVLTGAAAYCVVEPTGRFQALAAGGIAMLVGSVAVLVLPRSRQGVVAAPLTVGTSLVLLGVLRAWSHIDTARAAGVVVALLTVLVLLAPWIGLAQMPLRVDALTLTRRTPFDPSQVASQVRVGQTLALALRIGAGVMTVGLAPVLGRYPAGAALMAAVGLAHLLGTRSLAGRAEVFAGALTGIFSLVLAGVALTVARPGLLVWSVVAATLVGVLELAVNVVSVKMRPHLSRAADALHIASLMAVLPLLAWVWGVR